MHGEGVPGVVRRLVQSGRSTFYCETCQPREGAFRAMADLTNPACSRSRMATGSTGRPRATRGQAGALPAWRPGQRTRDRRLRRHFDGARYRIVGIDQRGCGRSRPLATSNLGRLSRNTTQAVIADIEAVRRHLGIERWLVTGNPGAPPWRSPTAAASRPGSALVLAAVTTTSQTRSPGSPNRRSVFFRRRGTPSRSVRPARGRAHRRGLCAAPRGHDASDRRRGGAGLDAWEDMHVSLDRSLPPAKSRTIRAGRGVRDPGHALLGQ